MLEIRRFYVQNILKIDKPGTNWPQILIKPE